MGDGVWEWGEGEREGPGAGAGGGEGAGGAGVDRYLEAGGGGLESAGGRMGAEFAGEDEVTHSRERRQAEGGGLTDPRGVGGKFVEEKARVVGEAPGVGAAGRRRAMSGTHGVAAEGRGGGGGWQNFPRGGRTGGHRPPL